MVCELGNKMYLLFNFKRFSGVGLFVKVIHKTLSTFIDLGCHLVVKLNTPVYQWPQYFFGVWTT